MTLKENDNTPADETRWIVPYADLVTLLLGLFVVLYASSDIERAKQIASMFRESESTVEVESPDDFPSESEEAPTIKTELLSQVTLRETKNKRIYSLDGAAFFQPGKSEISDASKREIQKLAAILRDSVGEITVEGHTDSTPISNSQYRSNWELSTARASSVLAVLINSDISPERLSASGYGGFRPVASNDSPENRKKNRRVDIVVEKLTVSTK